MSFCHLGLVFLVLIWTNFGLAAKSGNATGMVDDANKQWCRVCHFEEKYTAVTKSVHGDLNCRDCHQSYHFNPHEAVQKPSDDIKVFESHGAKDPVALKACTECHSDIAEEGVIPHGASQGKKSGAPFCLNCHGDPHVIQASTKLVPFEARLKSNHFCANCHGDAAKMKEAGLNTQAVSTYEHSTHGRKLHLGSDKVPGCATCHGGHAQATLHSPQTHEMCKGCHSGATEAFVKLAAHRPLTPEGQTIGYYTVHFFAALTFLVILFLGLHVLFDFAATVRVLIFQKRTGAVSARHAREEEITVQRFDIHQRIQHGLMGLSFIFLVLTGWPLSSHSVESSKYLVALFGGIDGCGTIHRVAALGLVISAIYHLLYLIIHFRRGSLRFSMLPSLKDVTDLFHNLLFFVGLEKNRARFPRYSYFEKFDYWAVFWGMAIMVSSGFVRWFPDTVARFLPSWFYDICHYAHADEALLAALAIFMWHFYNVHLRLDVFPMSKVFLHGRLTLKQLEEEHGAEYEELSAQGKLSELQQAGKKGNQKEENKVKDE
ncbi:MAG: cytochrome b/b6 domain-containing protein [Deltaproteobacteria bacterium]|nr:cytochrome b/b6 domain-containing protein [Deltaproteobacteria bacterium]